LTGNHPFRHYQHTAYNRNNPVPCSWQTRGPITLAGDIEHAWRNWQHRQAFSQVNTDLRKGLGGSIVMTRATEAKQTWVLYWARERTLVICQRANDWDPNNERDVAYALKVIGGEIPLDGWITLARSLLDELKL
ncbi:hypothetical protein MTAB308_647, partial [Mycobacterium terramassiliense]